MSVSSQKNPAGLSCSAAPHINHYGVSSPHCETPNHLAQVPRNTIHGCVTKLSGFGQQIQDPLPPQVMCGTSHHPPDPLVMHSVCSVGCVSMQRSDCPSLLCQRQHSTHTYCTNLRLHLPSGTTPSPLSFPNVISSSTSHVHLLMDLMLLVRQHWCCCKLRGALYSRAFLRSCSSSKSRASLMGRPSGRAAGVELAVRTPFFRAASSSSTVPLSSRANLFSSLSDPTSIAVLSASASMASTFSSILSNATTALLVLREPIISWICLLVLALAARALRVSFLLLASASLPSSILVLFSSWSTAFCCCSSCNFSPSAWSWKDFRRFRASLARSSSFFCTASSARLSQSSAVTWACLYLASSCFCDAITCAAAWRILIRSSCISVTTWSSSFSGSSALLTTLLV
mmetsp:Transcript_26071/g.56932  ORF Transcript_26071/g.56932 Transcript_26071/m.56932 type:complete len:401 (+) Transcript_26071:227-1429(+)